NPLYVHNLISKDARTAGILVETYKRPEDPDYRKKVIEKTGLILKAFSEDSSFFHMAGWTNTNLSLSQYMKKDIATFIPITYLFITLAIWLIFRNVRLVLLAVLNISMCVGSTMGLFGLIGIKINNVTTIIPPLVMALALCDTVHIFSHVERAVLEKAGDKRKALAAVLQKVLVPSFLTTLTTGIGFLSLAVSRIPPIREFAWIASAGMAFEFLYSFFLLPPLILLFNPMKVFQAYETRKGMNGLLGFVANVVQSHARLIVMAGAMVVMTAFWFATQLQVETNLLEFFKKDSPLRQSITFVEKRLGGVDTLDISLRAEEEDAFKDPENLRILEKVQEFIASLEGVDYTVSFVDLLKDMNESFHEEDHAFYEIPESRDLVAQYLLLYDSEDLENLVNTTFDHARIAVRTSRHSSSQQADLIEEIREFIGRMNAPPHINLRVTGRAVQDVNTIDALVNGQVYSLALAAAVITMLMFFVMKSVKMGLLSIVPNVFPIIINFGIMGALGISLDTGTSLIAAVALGIAVDDTIHLLTEYRRSRSGSRAVSETVREVIFTKGRAIVSSSAILCIGFGVLVLSRFAPTMNFGMLSAIIMITALIGDLVVLPSVILLKRR
ncbi:MAG: MMPL family transporter, partial [Deltaproteobacteria bacterium]|nr:MMPL family transporter [Deltaproteobacteria bacterium]